MVTQGERIEEHEKIHRLLGSQADWKEVPFAEKGNERPAEEEKNLGLAPNSHSAGPHSVSSLSSSRLP